MAKKRRWKEKEKSRIILEGLKGRPVTIISIEYQINQSNYCSWRDQFLSNMGQVFELKKMSTREQHLKQQNTKLKNRVGELTYELENRRGQRVKPRNPLMAA